MSWPDTTDLNNYLIAAGLISAGITDTESELDLAGAIDAAVEQWNDETRYWPFQSTGTAQARRYTPPTGGILDLNGGLVALTSLYIDVTYTSAGTAYTNLQHFRLIPRDAPQRSRPWTGVEFLWSPQNVSDGEIEITGTWGYCLAANLPARASRGVLALAALELVPQIQQALTQGIVRWTEGDRSKQYADLPGAIGGWQAAANNDLRHFRRMRVA